MEPWIIEDLDEKRKEVPIQPFLELPIQYEEPEIDEKKEDKDIDRGVVIIKIWNDE